MKVPALLVTIATIAASVQLDAAMAGRSARVLEIPRSATLTGTIARSAIKTSDRGVFALPVKIFSSPASPGRPAIQRRLVVDANLHQIPFAARVRFNSLRGPRTDKVRLARADFEIDGAEFTRTVWMKSASCGPICGSADVAMGPVAFAQPIVRYVLNTPVRNERRIVLPLTIDARDNASSRIHHKGGQVEVLFATDTDVTVANASFARLVNAVPAVRSRPILVSGGSTEEDVMAVAATWTAPFPLGDLSITRAAVVDWTPVTSAPRSGDVVVKGRRGEPIQPILVIGLDVLSGCSSIEFDKERREITLSCR